MELILDKITIKGVEVTPKQAHDYLANKKIVLPPELALKIIDNRYPQKQQIKNTVSLKTVSKQ